MIVPDANLLLYATDSASPFFDAASAWWTDCLNGTTPVGLCHPVVFAFVRISTNRRVSAQPLSLAQVTEIVRSWSDRQVTRMLYPGPRHVRNVLGLLATAGPMAAIWSPMPRLPSLQSPIEPKCIPRIVIFCGFPT